MSTSSFIILLFISSTVSSSWFSSARCNACRRAFFAFENSPEKATNRLKRFTFQENLKILQAENHTGSGPRKEKGIDGNKS